MVKTICDKCGEEIRNEFRKIRFYRSNTVTEKTDECACLEKDICLKCYDNFFSKEGKIYDFKTRNST